MKKNAHFTSRSDELLLRAERHIEQLERSHAASEAEVRRLVHELHNYQIRFEKVKDELATSEQRAMLAIEASNAAMWDYDLTTGKVYLSGDWSSFLGGSIKPTHTTIQALMELVPAEERPMVMEAITNTTSVDGPSKFKLNHRAKKLDGSYIWLHACGRAIDRGRNGRARRIIGMSFDITEHIEAENKLTDSEQRFRALFESAGEFALVLQLQESGPPIIVDGNHDFFEKVGYTRDELIGQPVTMIETMTSAEEIADRTRLVKTGKTASFEVEHRCKDGSTFNAEAMARMVTVNGVDIVYAVVRDTTERRQAEQEIQQLLTEKRQLLRQLIRVQEEERRALAHDLHDELGQLLTSIAFQSQYIVTHANDTDLHEAAVNIERDVQATFAVSQAELSRLRPASLDVLGLETALIELTNNMTKKTGMNCNLRVEGEFDQLDDMYAITIYRLVQEALTNSQRHGMADRAEVIVKQITPQEGHAGEIAIEIKDNGHGFDKKKLFKGLGTIGMRERVKALEGTFRLSHVPGDGVCVKAILPLFNTEMDEN